jgi:hypothetical protein
MSVGSGCRRLVALDAITEEKIAMKLLSQTAVMLLAAAAGLLTVSAQAYDDHPFALVNVIDLFDAHSDRVGFDTTFNPNDGPPDNWGDPNDPNSYRNNPRVGTNPGVIAVGGNRLWIAGYNNNGSRFDGDTVARRNRWYASLGIVEVRNIITTSGFDAPFEFYLDSFIYGPTVGGFEMNSGIDYDVATGMVYVAYDDNEDKTESSFPTGADPQVGAYLAGYDADPNSASYQQEMFYLEDPVTPFSPPFGPFGDRFYGGVAVDPFNPDYLIVPQNGAAGAFWYINVTDPGSFDENDPNHLVYVKDDDVRSSECGSTFYRSLNIDPVSGDMALRNANAVALVERDGAAAPYRAKSRFIEEPEGGDGFANTVADANDEQLIALNQVVSDGDNIVGPGPDGVLTTLPAGDDIYSLTEIVQSRPIGTFSTGIGDNCNDDPNGFGFGPFAQGQGSTLISADNIVVPDPNGEFQPYGSDLLIANSRIAAEALQLKDIRLVDRDGLFVAELELPCTPEPIVDPNTGFEKGLAFYDFDYDPTTGTLVVLEMEQRKVYVFRANLAGSNIVSTRYDWNRDSNTDLIDFAAFQERYTGADAGPLNLAEQRMNTDSDCDLDFVDYENLVAFWDQFGGP